MAFSSSLSLLPAFLIFILFLAIVPYLGWWWWWWWLGWDRDGDDSCLPCHAHACTHTSLACLHTFSHTHPASPMPAYHPWNRQTGAKTKRTVATRQAGVVVGRRVGRVGLEDGDRTVAWVSSWREPGDLARQQQPAFFLFSSCLPLPPSPISPFSSPPYLLFLSLSLLPATTSLSLLLPLLSLPSLSLSSLYVFPSFAASLTMPASSLYCYLPRTARTALFAAGKRMARPPACGGALLCIAAAGVPISHYPVVVYTPPRGRGVNEPRRVHACARGSSFCLGGRARRSDHVAAL